MLLLKCLVVYPPPLSEPSRSPLMQVSRSALHRKNCRLLRASLVRWSSNAQTSTRQREHYLLARKKLAISTQRRCWGRMRAFFRLMQAAAAHRRRRAKRNAVRCWRHSTDLWRRGAALQRFAAVSRARVALATLIRSLFVHDGAAVAVGSVVDRLRGAAALRHWIKRCVGRRAYRVASRRAAHSAASRAVMLWRQWSHDRRTDVRVLAFVRQRLLRRLVTSSLTSWRSAVQRRRVETLRSAVLERLSSKHAASWALKRLSKQLKRRRRVMSLLTVRSCWIFVSCANWQPCPPPLPFFSAIALYRSAPETTQCASQCPAGVA
jgi:hypothetical protein